MQIRCIFAQHGTNAYRNELFSLSSGSVSSCIYNYMFFKAIKKSL
ncbi:hypothetical protein PESP_a2514 [Pseudoalteromonas espejiana DSM 9414]|nr:hypothetical protein PESP_a2514 [Pseudoalteromonas espejiana DSM 9414]